MNLTILVLPQSTQQSAICTATVNPQTSILELKNHIEEKLGIPIEHQKLIYLGRALLDEDTIENYPMIKDGTKLALVVKKPEPLEDVMLKCFLRFYSEQQSEKLVQEFIKDFNKKVSDLSLDDIERLAITLTKPTSHA